MAMHRFSTQRECAAALSKLTAQCPEGEDSKGNCFADIAALWSAKLPLAADHSWYRRGAKYWAHVAANDYSGVLGGQEHVHDMDIECSGVFLRDVQGLRAHVAAGCVLDCGAGMGRVSEALLVKHWPSVQLLEPSAKLLAAARRRLEGHPRVTGFLGCGLQEHAFGPPGTFTCVWMQWVTGALLDVDLLTALVGAAGALAPGGVIIVKENVCRKREGGKALCFWYDEEDSYVVRGVEYTEALFALAGLRVILSREQAPWDDELLPVRLFALERVVQG